MKLACGWYMHTLGQIVTASITIKFCLPKIIEFGLERGSNFLEMRSVQVDLCTAGIWTLIAHLILVCASVVVLCILPDHLHTPSLGNIQATLYYYSYFVHESRMHCSCCKYLRYRRVSLSPKACVLFVSLYTSALMNYSWKQYISEWQAAPFAGRLAHVRFVPSTN